MMNHSHHMHHTTTPMSHAGHTTMGHHAHAGHTTMHHMPGMNHMMKMYFHGDYEGDYVLFKPFQLQSAGGLAGACVVLFIVAFLYEGLKVGRELLMVRAKRSRGSAYAPSSSQSAANGQRLPLLSFDHVIQTVLHVIQVTVSYLLMLAVMTFNVWIGLSVVLGAGAGYFAFAWKRAVVVDVNEHCM